jgi:hypothetical protein
MMAYRGSLSDAFAEQLGRRIGVQIPRARSSSTSCPTTCG